MRGSVISTLNVAVPVSVPPLATFGCKTGLVTKFFGNELLGIGPY
jgi:hypothetical protein